MTIPEASRLVIQAGALGANGAVFVLDMGEPVRIVDLAREMIHLAGADEDDIGMVFTGARPGEKVHEELFTDEEQLGATTHRQIMVAHHEPALDEEGRGWVGTLIEAAERRDWPELDRCLKVLLPDYGLTPGPDVVSGSSLGCLSRLADPGGPNTMQPDELPQPLDFRRLLSVLRRRRFSIALVTVSITLLAWAWWHGGRPCTRPWPKWRFGRSPSMSSSRSLPTPP